MYDVSKSKVVPVDIDKEMKKSFLDYSMSVIVARALPDVRDGLKPVHRRILYTLYENGLTPDKPYRKCADTVGAVLGRYHPHGDASVYDALVRLAQDFSLRYPLVDGHGNFGSVDGDPPAAYRYTEAKMSKISVDMLTDISKETVPFTSNYDDRLKEPEVLPSRFPNLLVNGSTGIAVGMATNIPPHNLGEVVNALKCLIDNPDASLDEIMQYIKAPDFPTGGVIMGRAGIRSAYSSGRGKITLRARTSFEEIKGRNCIVITEIPYMVNKARLIEHMASLAKEKRVEGIHFIRDESDRSGMRIVIELKKDAVPQLVLNKLLSFTQLQDTVGVIMLALVDGEPKVLPLKDILVHYLSFQRDVIANRTRFDLRKAQEKAHILEGIAVAIDNIDEVIDIMRSSSNIPDGKQRLIQAFSISEIQADAIVQMTIGKLTGLEKQKVNDELNDLHSKIDEFNAILADDSKIYDIIKTDLTELSRRYSDERRTSVEEVSGEVVEEDLIPVENCVFTYTDIGYVKRTSLDTYKTQKRGGRGVSGVRQREEDFVSEMFIASSHDNILFITNKGLMYKLKGYEIQEGSKSSRGTNIINLLNLSEGEKIEAVLKTPDFNENSYIVFVTKNGTVKRTSLSAYRHSGKRGLIAISLVEGDEIAGVRITNGNAQLFIATKFGKVIRINETCIRLCGRNSKGVRGIKLKDDDSVVSMARYREGASLLTITDKGLGRRTNTALYPLQNRGGYGVKNYNVSEIKGNVCGIKIVDDTDDIVMISTSGVIIRFKASDISLCGRTASGVKVMKFADDESRVVAFTRVEHDENAETVHIENTEDDSEEISDAQEDLD